MIKLISWENRTPTAQPWNSISAIFLDDNPMTLAEDSTLVLSPKFLVLKLQNPILSEKLIWKQETPWNPLYLMGKHRKTMKNDVFSPLVSCISFPLNQWSQDKGRRAQMERLQRQQERLEDAGVWTKTGDSNETKIVKNMVKIDRNLEVTFGRYRMYRMYRS